MIMMQSAAGGVCAAKGFKAAGVHCGIRKNHDKKDLMLVVSDAPCTAAAVYTQNKVFGAPITVTRKHIANGTAQAFVCNSGNANTCNFDGVDKANEMCALVSQETGLSADDIIVASTGVIGQPIDMAPIKKGVSMLAPILSYDGGHDAALAIMTTDLLPKESAYTAVIGGKQVTVGAMCKGSGMIHPNMATMLCFVTSDACISSDMLHQALVAAVQDTFNMVSIDGDTSTNDMCAVMANGLAGNAEIAKVGADFDAFCALLQSALVDLARMMASDGEGATKLITCVVSGAPDVALGKKIAKSVVCSSLVKAAMFGADANWGRILCAIGYTEGDFSIDDVEVSITSPAGSVTVCKHGAGVPFSEEVAKRVLLEHDVTLLINMHLGEAEATAWGCDLTYDYVKINGDYRT